MCCTKVRHCSSPERVAAEHNQTMLFPRSSKISPYASRVEGLVKLLDASAVVEKEQTKRDNNNNNNNNNNSSNNNNNNNNNNSNNNNNNE